MAHPPRLIETIDVGDALGEGVLWRSSDSSVWWTDIVGRRVHRMSWPGLKLETFETPERLGSFAFVAGADEVMVAAFETGFALYRPRSGDVGWLSALFTPGAGVRLNDGRVDPAGRFWSGSMVESEGVDPASGALYRVDESGAASHVRDGLRIANGICWSVDGTRMHYADSAARTLYVAPYDAATGAVGNAEVFARTPDGAFPDGAVMDARDVLWTALWGGGAVACFDPAGRRVGDIDIPATQPSCPGFGGDALDVLFVTSARDGMDAAALAEDSAAGHLFIFETTACGLLPTDASMSQRVITPFI